MRYIEALKEGEHVSEIYFCKQKQSLTTKAGKPYDSLILQDKTGTIDAKIWDVSSQGIYDFEAMNYVEDSVDNIWSVLYSAGYLTWCDRLPVHK